MKELMQKTKNWVKNTAVAVPHWVFNLAKKILKYTRINDEKNCVSLTNIAMMIVMHKMLVTNATSWQDLSALAIAILGYQIKRIVENK